MTRLGALFCGLLYGMSVRLTFQGGYLQSLTSSIEDNRALQKEQFANAPRPGNGTSNIVDNNNFVLAVIENPAMEKDSTKVQRMIQSARTRGNWKGPIAVVTDSKDAYHDLVQEDPFVYLVDPIHKPLWDSHDTPEFNRAQMNLARQKTLVLDYVTADARMKDAEFVLYLDADFVVNEPILPWLQQKWNEGHSNRQKFYANLSSIYMFQKGSDRSADTGVIFMHKDLSYTCARKWRSLIPRYLHVAPDDEWLIRTMIASPGPMKCKIRVWDPKAEDLAFVETPDLVYQVAAQFVGTRNEKQQRVESILAAEKEP